MQVVEYYIIYEIYFICRQRWNVQLLHGNGKFIIWNLKSSFLLLSFHLNFKVISMLSLQPPNFESCSRRTLSLYLNVNTTFLKSSLMCIMQKPSKFLALNVRQHVLDLAFQFFIRASLLTKRATGVQKYKPGILMTFSTQKLLYEFLFYLSARGGALMVQMRMPIDC